MELTILMPCLNEAETLAVCIEKAKTFSRYKDIDGDGIPYRTLPGTEHPLAAYFTRGTGHDGGARHGFHPPTLPRPPEAPADGRRLALTSHDRQRRCDL